MRRISCQTAMLESIFCGCWFIIIDETGKTANAEPAKAESSESEPAKAESLPEVQPEVQREAQSETQSKSSYSYDENSRPVTVKTENAAPADYAQTISALREVYTSVKYNNKNQISSC